MMRSGALFVVFIFLFLQQDLVSAQESEVEGRQPKLFYVTTKSSTSTVTTFSLCVQSAATLTTCKKRRRRQLPDEAIEQSQDMPKIAPSDVQSGLENEHEERAGKFLVYWLTTTSTSVSTLYTATSTIGSIYCTPASFPHAICGGNRFQILVFLYLIVSTVLFNVYKKIKKLHTMYVEN